MLAVVSVHCGVDPGGEQSVRRKGLFLHFSKQQPILYQRPVLCVGAEGETERPIGIGWQGSVLSVRSFVPAPRVVAAEAALGGSLQSETSDGTLSLEQPWEPLSR